MFAAHDYYTGYPSWFDDYEEELSVCDNCKYDCSEIGVCIALTANKGDDPDAL